MDDKLSIGAVSQLTGVSQHTLRKWESRHGIGIPERSETGRRVYSRETVGQLRAIKGLLDQGHSLAHLTGKSADQLREMLGDHDILRKESLEFDKMIAVTESPPLELRKIFGTRGKIIEATLKNLGAIQASEFDGGKLLVLIEQSSMLVEEAEELASLLSPGWQAIVCVKYLSKSGQKRLSSKGAKIVDWPLSRESLGIGSAMTHLSAPDLLVKERMFNEQTLKKLVAIKPSLDCECPNHIAKLLIDIAAFENYCKSCEDTDPLQQKLHRDLATLTGLARMKFEEGLIEIAKVDDIDLSMS